MSAQHAAAPLPESERIESLDLLRGFALLGILLMNIQSFSMPGSAYMNPTNFGDLAGVNFWAWSVTHVLADQKFMSIFSMLFGAGMCVFIERAVAKRGRAAGLHYLRMFWLLVFGLLHAHLIWYGDILVSYALCGALTFLFRNRSPRALLIWSAIFLGVPVLYNGFAQSSMAHLPEASRVGMGMSWAPPQDRVQAEVTAYLGTWSEQQAQRQYSAVILETLVFLVYFFWRAMGMMLLGMALYKLGVLSGKRSGSFYRRMALLGVVPGGVLCVFGVAWNFEHEWALEHSMFGGSLFNYFGSIAMALGYVGLLMTLHRSGKLSALQDRLSAVGRMALTNYIAQSLLCTLLFYGFGFGLFGSLERWEQLLVVFGVWAVQLAWSPIWLRRFRFGPLEWLWRALTYLKRPPMRV